MTAWLMSVVLALSWSSRRRSRAARPGRRPAIATAVGAAILVGVGLAPSALAGAPGDADAAAAPEPSAQTSTILVLGDSISAGYGIQRDQSWVSRLRQRIAGDGGAWRVINASVSGETTEGGLARLPGALAEHDPAIVIIELGGNDGLRGYPVDSIRDNLRRMVALARNAGSRVLLVGMQIPPNYGPRYTEAFADVFREVARTENVPLVPFLLDQVALKPELMQRDGIHPTAAAQAQLLDTVWPHLAPLLKTSS